MGSLHFIVGFIAVYLAVDAAVNRAWLAFVAMFCAALLAIGAAP